MFDEAEREEYLQLKFYLNENVGTTEQKARFDELHPKYCKQCF